jgi:putative oxidoreductase
MDVILIIGRVLFAAVLLNSGIAHFAKLDAMAGYAAHKKVPAAKVAVGLSGLVLVLGSLSIILGVLLDLGALAVAILLVIMALKMHDFWTADEASKQNETIQFFKNISMAGAALVMFAAVANSEVGADVLGPMISGGAFGG